ncbi:MAG: hypothetical protein JNK87_16975 [Bryobacterales bacterium]|nr:hypothetical protein [Bryobacterales bacterium]
MNDDELRSLLRKWEAPPAPDSLRRRVLPARPRFDWRWLWTGELRIPVPAALAAVFVLLFAMYGWRRPTAPPSLSDFQQVSTLQPRIVRTVHEIP